MDLQSIHALKDMLDSAEQDSESDDDKPCTAAAKLGPGSIGPSSKPKPDTKSGSGNQTTGDSNSKDIWESEEVNVNQHLDDIHDPRPQPEYDIVYKQAVTSEDMFLGMGNKTPTTASCEDMIVKIKLPNTKAADMELDVKPQFLDCRTPKYKLGLHLPHPVHDKNGNAKWNSDTCELQVTLRMNRDMDFMNF